MFRSFNKAKQRNIIYAIVLNAVLCASVFAHVNCFGEKRSAYGVCICGLKFKRRHSIMKNKRKHPNNCTPFNTTNKSFVKTHLNNFRTEQQTIEMPTHTQPPARKHQSRTENLSDRRVAMNRKRKTDQTSNGYKQNIM